MSFVPILTSLAIILLGALAGGRLASLCHIPRVTGYLLTGLLLGPSLAHLLGIPADAAPGGT
jgi:Kef-type K+ transport system membrane component KefB